MKCPTCQKPSAWKDNEWRPFCSERCRLIDFGHWADEDYRLPDEESVVSPNEDEAAPAQARAAGEADY